MADSSQRTIADAFDRYETVTRRELVERTDELTHAFTLESTTGGGTIDVWETREGAHLCNTPSACYRLPAGVAPLLLLYPLVETDAWTITDDDSQRMPRPLERRARRDS